ncbi:hypothetical protein LTR36_010505 [Oleoguttula mirabilis]|uniref:Argonaute linker 1 domain-containing protein n=1 Tax=Oleoguttula mirabilis TaxID=1507867 RepID=A0AAV9J496_9PEZI|nr:hypothetical protein LTR36_010505 [Oleoguttula mirabilis]
MPPKKKIPCPRCPLDSPYPPVHGKARDGLIRCQAVDCTHTQYSAHEFWPEITTTRQDMDKDEGDRYDVNFAEVATDAQLARDMYAALRGGEKAFRGVRFTKTLAERVVGAVGQNAATTAAAAAAAAPSTSTTTTSAGAQQGGQSAVGQSDVVGATQDLAALGLSAQANTFSPGPAVTGTAAMSATLPAVATGTTPQANITATPSGQTAANQPAPPAQLANVPAPVVPAAPLPLGPPPLNPAVAGLDLRQNQTTDQPAALQYVQTIAANLLADERRRELARNPTTQQLPLNDVQKKAALQRIMHKFALRSGFAPADARWTIETNHLVMGFPTMIYVYAVEMIRDLNPLGNPIYVKKQADKLLALEASLSLPLCNNLQTHRNSWVTDGDLIWSTVPLLPTVNVQTLPQPIILAGTVANPVALQYDNEMGARLDIRRVQIDFNITIDLSRPVGELFYDTTAGSYDDSVPGILTRGLNTFFTSYVRNNPAMFTAFGRQNKCFFNNQGYSLDSPPQQPTLRAMKGYYLSVRPGVQSLFLNINTATSPFYQNLLVSDLISRMTATGAAGQSRPQHEVARALKGVKVRIEYNTNVNFPTEASRTRFIDSVGLQVQAQPTQLPNVMLSAWYNRAGPYTGLPDYPNPAWAPLATELAINVGKDPFRFPGQEEWYPASCLRIVQWHPYRGLLTPAQTSMMITHALLPPDQHRGRILASAPQLDTPSSLGGLLHFGFAGAPAAGTGQAGLQALNMHAGTQFLRIPGRML